MKLFDTHAHCDDERIEKEYQNGAEGLITDCLGANIDNIVNTGTNCKNSKRSVELAEKFDVLKPARMHERAEYVYCHIKQMPEYKDYYHKDISD